MNIENVKGQLAHVAHVIFTHVWHGQIFLKLHGFTS